MAGPDRAAQRGTGWVGHRSVMALGRMAASNTFGRS
jgi:hypothetical protein